MRPAIHVVAGLLVDGNRVCLTRRRADAHQGDKWEFPGGKLDPDESPLAGLKRELHEELGIEVERAQPFICVRHRYPEVDVLLDVWRVTRYRGTPHGREAQELRWVEYDRLSPSEFPEADRPVLRRLQLPSLYLISDARRIGATEFLDQLERAVAAGARLIQLREAHLDRENFCAYARQIAARCRRYGARLIVNADPEWLLECEADGVHLNRKRLMALGTRPVGPDPWVAASCHDETELRRAQELPVDFAVLGPVMPTASHAGAETLGWERFAALCGSTVLPIYAIGGMRSTDLSQAHVAGAQGLAMISGVWQSQNFEAIVRELRSSDQLDRERVR